MDQYFLVFSCLGLGAIAGFLGGLLGIGGGIIVVPALIFLFDYLGFFNDPAFPENTAILVVLGTSLASIVFTTMGSAAAQWHRRAIDWQIVKSWIPYLVIGAFIASFVAKALPAFSTKLFIGMFIFCVAMTVLFDFAPDPERKLPNRLVTGIVALFGGLICGLAGIGGGNVVVPTLLFFNTQVRKATAIASTLGFAISAAGTIGYILNGIGLNIPNAVGYIYLPAIVPLAIGALVFAPLGVFLAHRMRSGLLRKTFGILMIVVSARMVYSAF